MLLSVNEARRFLPLHVVFTNIMSHSRQTVWLMKDKRMAENKTLQAVMVTWSDYQ